MLGKGLESLIPKNNGNQGSQPGNDPARPAQQPSPAAQSQPQPQPQSQPRSQPATAPAPAALPAEPHREELPPPPQEPQLPAQPARQAPQAEKKIEWPAVAAVKKEEPQQGSIFHIELDKIIPNPDQPRRHFDQEALRELAGSIREFGMLQPIVVSKVDRETPNGVEVEYQIIAGERRFMASKMLGLPRVPAIVRNVNLEREKLELGVIENIQREDLNPIEMARAFQRLQEEFRMTQREIAAKLGKSREVVANAVRLLDLPEYIQTAVENGELSESNARMLIPIEDQAMQKRLLEDIVRNKLTTRDVRAKVEATLAARDAAAGPGTGSGSAPAARRRGRPPKEQVQLPPEVKILQDELRASLGAPVDIVKNAASGKITITFFSEEELKNILEKLRDDSEGGF